MRPMSAPAVASVITSAAPPTARLPRWTTCQSFENPSTLEYSHIGETTMRLESVSERKEIGSNRCGIALDYAMRGWGAAHRRGRAVHAIEKQHASRWSQHVASGACGSRRRRLTDCQCAGPPI